jgi:hypothetical protein
LWKVVLVEGGGFLIYGKLDKMPAPPVTITIRVMPPMFRMPRWMGPSQSVDCGERLFWRRGEVFLLSGG